MKRTHAFLAGMMVFLAVIPLELGAAPEVTGGITSMLRIETEQHGMQDTIPGKGEAGIKAPWNKIDLASSAMKPGFPFTLESGKRFPWLPVILGTAGGGVVIYLLTQKKQEETPCTVSISFEIVPATCGRPDGSIMLVTPDLSDAIFLWDDGSSGPIRSGLIPGVYMVTVTDGAGKCTTRRTYEVPDMKVEPTATFQFLPPDCGRSNGAIETEVMPQEAYQFSWSSGQTTPDVTGLPAGQYILSISLGVNCISTFDVTLPEAHPDITIDAAVNAGTCSGGGDIIIDIRTGTGNSVVHLSIDGPGGTRVLSLADGRHQLSDHFVVKPGGYTLSGYDELEGPGCVVSTMVTVPNEGEALVASDDRYQTPFQTPLDGNFLVNDRGDGLTVLAVGDPGGGAVNWSSDGSFTFIPDIGFSGETSFQYELQDACDSTDHATVTIEVLPKGCDFTIQFTFDPASCGYPDGSVSVVVNEPGNYTYWWDNGQTGPQLTGVQAGEYIVHIRDESLGCTLDFTVIVGERPAMYMENIRMVSPVCSTPGEILFDAVTPSGGPLTMEVFHPGGFQSFSISPGMVLLSEYVPIVEGVYKVTMMDESIGAECIHDFSMVMGPMQIIELALEGIMPPSMPTAKDGAIFAVVVDPGMEPYQIFLNGVLYGTVTGSFIAVTGLGVGVYDLWVVDAKGCMSNILQVPIIFVGDPEFVGIRYHFGAFPIGGTPEHPVNDNYRLGQSAELFGNFPLTGRSMSIEAGLLIQRSGPIISGGLRSGHDWGMHPGWKLSGDAQLGFLWNGKASPEAYALLAPSISHEPLPGIRWRLQVNVRYTRQGWDVIPSAGLEFPLMKGSQPLRP